MDHMMDHDLSAMGPMMILWWALMAVLGALAIAVIIFLAKRVPTGRYAVSQFPGASELPLRSSSLGEVGSSDSSSAEARDTLFILPDISHYTRFMTGSHFAFAHAQHIVLSLIRAMIEAATQTVEISKLEGDAALFFVDTGRHSNTVIGTTVMNIFAAFFRERKRLSESNICPCRACSHILDLDLKIFVHRGQAARFQFRGSVDLFGTDVIVLHRLMKNGVRGHRYVMVTDAAANHIQLPHSSGLFEVEEQVEHIGSVRATVHEIDDTLAQELADSSEAQPLSPATELLRKFRENARSIRSVLGHGKKPA